MNNNLQFITTPLRVYLTNYPAPIINLMVGEGIDRANTVAELWAQWVSAHGRNFDELFNERGVNDETVMADLIAVLERVDVILTPAQ